MSGRTGQHRLAALLAPIRLLGRINRSPYVTGTVAVVALVAFIALYWRTRERPVVTETAHPEMIVDEIQQQAGSGSFVPTAIRPPSLRNEFTNPFENRIKNREQAPRAQITDTRPIREGDVVFLTGQIEPLPASAIATDENKNDPATRR